MPDPELRPAYSYRDDPRVPPFDDTAPVVVMDGDCALCAFGARMINRYDSGGTIRICRSQSALGSALLAHYGLVPDDPESWLMIADGHGLTAMDAVIHLGAVVRGPGLALQGLRVMPRGLRDWIYRRIARNRYHLFGRADLCGIPDPGLRERLLE
ncbi:MAG: DCC1-like thiol-disulfide oxidoreductase family protein [Pseudomonadota bacterium]